MSSRDEALSDVEYAALANLRYTIRRFRQFSAKMAYKLGLTPQQHQALLAIKGLGTGGGMTISMLAKKLVIVPEAAAELTSALQEHGYLSIETRRKRQQVVQLTEKADEILRRLTPAHLYEIRTAAPELMQSLRILQDHQRMEVAAWMQ